MKTFVTIFGRKVIVYDNLFSYSLPLPTFEHIGTLDIQRPSAFKTRTKLMSLPVKDRALSVKVMYFTY